MRNMMLRPKNIMHARSKSKWPSNSDDKSNSKRCMKINLEKLSHSNSR